MSCPDGESSKYFVTFPFQTASLRQVALICLTIGLGVRHKGAKFQSQKYWIGSNLSCKVSNI